MENKEITQFLSDKHRILMLLGGLISFLSLFLPFFSINAILSGGYVTISGFSLSLSDTWLFWLYLILLIGVFLGYFLGYGEKFPYLFLVIGVFLFLLTIVGIQIYSQTYDYSLSFGFFLEIIGTIGIIIGGYYYYMNNNKM